MKGDKKMTKCIQCGNEVGDSPWCKICNNMAKTPFWITSNGIHTEIKPEEEQ